MSLNENNVQLHLFTGRVINSTYFKESNSLSITLVVDTRDGKLIKDKIVSIDLTDKADLAQRIYDRKVKVVGFQAEGFSLQPKKDTDAIFKMVGLRKRSIEAVLEETTEVDLGEDETDEKVINRKRGFAQTTLDWLRSKVAEAVKG